MLTAALSPLLSCASSPIATRSPSPNLPAKPSPEHQALAEDSATSQYPPDFACSTSLGVQPNMTSVSPRAMCAFCKSTQSFSSSLTFSNPPCFSTHSAMPFRSHKLHSPTHDRHPAYVFRSHCTGLRCALDGLADARSAMVSSITLASAVLVSSSMPNILCGIRHVARRQVGATAVTQVRSASVDLVCQLPKRRHAHVPLAAVLDQLGDAVAYGVERAGVGSIRSTLTALHSSSTISCSGSRIAGSHRVRPSATASRPARLVGQVALG